MTTLTTPPMPLVAGREGSCALWRDLAHVPASLGSTVVAIGQFDGVHRGHQRLVREALRRARDQETVTGVVTFDRHPSTVLSPRHTPPALMGLAEKVERLAACGVDFVLALPPSVELLQTSPAQFVRGVLVDTLDCRSVVVGSNFRFGHRAAGTPGTLAGLGSSTGLEVIVMDLLEHDGLPVSSTRIRAEIAAGRLSAAAKLLGRAYQVEAMVTAHPPNLLVGRLCDGTLWPGSGRYRCLVHDAAPATYRALPGVIDIDSVGAVTVEPLSPVPGRDELGTRIHVEVLHEVC